MQLSAKPNFDQAKDAWNHYWARAPWKRPLLVANVRKPDAQPPAPYDHYYATVHGDINAIRQRIDWQLASHQYLAESIPYFGYDLGPDQFAAWIGDGKLHFSEASKSTNWFEPCVKDWRDALPLTLREDNPAWIQSQKLGREVAAICAGRCLTGICDLHSNADALSALRGPQNLCMDFYDCPDLIGEAMRQVRTLYPPVYKKLYKTSGRTTETGTIGWIPFWCAGRYATIQCDFICMVSPEISRQFIIPALAEEAEFLDHCIYHLDGPGTLPHLDDILSIKAIDAIQWVSGDGQPPMHTWLDVLKKCQAAGKGLQIYGVKFDEIKMLTRELKPEGIVYCLGVDSEKELDTITLWLEQHAGVSRWV